MWLLVFDNADNPDMSLVPFLPAGDRGDIIVTSRNPQCEHYSTVGSRELGTLPLDDSVSLLSKVIYGVTSLRPPFINEAKRIVEVLGCLALAIVQAGAYIRETSCTPQEYLDTYETRKERVLQYLPKHTGTDYRYSVYTTWQILIDAIKSRGDATSDHALRLLSLLGFYHHDQIPTEMFYRAWHQRWMSEVPDYVPWHDTTSDFFQYQQSIQASTSLLASFSLITCNVDASLTLHPLVHEWCRNRMSKEEQELSYQQALSLLDSSVEWKFETGDYDFRRRLVSHVHELLRTGEHQGPLSENKQIQIWHNLALILRENGWIGGALQLSEAVWKLCKDKLGENHPDTLTSMNNLANRYGEAGRRTEALEMSETVWKLRKDKLGENHPDTLMSINNLAVDYSGAGRWTEALNMSEAVWKRRKDKLGEDHPDTLISMSNLANRYFEAGRRIEALEMLETVWKLHKDKLGKDHPNTLDSIYNLALKYSEAGRRTEALEMSEMVLKMRKDKLGEDHPDTSHSARLHADILENIRGESPKPLATQHSRHRLSKFWRKIRF